MLNWFKLGKIQTVLFMFPSFKILLVNNGLLHFQNNFIYTLQQYHCHRIAAVQLEACQHLSFQHMKCSVAREILLPLLFLICSVPLISC